ncbi:sensor histidine kinase [Rhizomonospora bruguierae]|uniref:sensor histidine kinase n=1 Tax=Rhizomonospora bruguierae TaxID=1581705 RepID=UPI001BCE1CA3|nr:ATP-binding protein [Micromonospora sp. NBRC 107566]
MTPGLLGFSESALPTGAVRGLGWPAFGIVAALLLDRDPRSRLGRSFAALAAVPAVVAVAALLAPDERVGWSRLEHWWDRLGVTPVVATLAVIAWGVDRAADRMARRRLFWLVVCSAALVGTILVASVSAGPRGEAVVTTLGLWAVAGVVYRLVTIRELRPIDEPLVDVVIAAATVGCAAGVGTLVRIAGTRAGIPGPDVSGAFTAVVTAGLVIPAGLWLRRLFLQRRYGRGTLTAADVAQITSDLHTLTDARDLLGKAAAMVAAASGHRQIGLVLGPDAPDVPRHWVLYPLVVGGDRVGTAFLEPAHREGPEPRQQRIVAQLLPTVSLVAKAVSLAVEADHARRDVARQREAERARILGDLHDGLGPVLVGMSMRVRAELRQQPTPLLEAFASDLADCRSDLRRIVSGLTPSVLDDGDLTTALRRLIGSFAGHGPTVALDIRVNDNLAPEIAVAVYRSVAEGVTNALRHARAGQVSVKVHTVADGRVTVDVHDDGIGGPIVWGVGLSSLRRRAHDLGGTVRVAADHRAGTRLHLELPTRKLTT